MEPSLDLAREGFVFRPRPADAADRPRPRIGCVAGLLMMDGRPISADEAEGFAVEWEARARMHGADPAFASLFARAADDARTALARVRYAALARNPGRGA